MEMYNPEPFIIQCIENCELKFDHIPVTDCIPKSSHPEYKFLLVEQHAFDQEIQIIREKQIIEQY